MRRRLAAAAALSALLAACSVSTLQSDGAPRQSLDPASIADAVPRADPITARGNTSPYTVLGRQYQVMPDYRGFRQRGRASWYGTKFHGRPTANGETYSLYGMTAAHRNLPIPVYVRVTNLENGLSTVVRVNDRGPFHSERIIDLSYAAAVKLGFAEQGTAAVEIQVIDTDNRPLAGAGQGERGPGSYYLQLGAFSTAASADSLRSRLATALPHPVVVTTTVSRPVLHRVRLGPFSDYLAAQRAREALPPEYGRDARIVNDIEPVPSTTRLSRTP